MFLVRLVALNAGDLVVSELLAALWRDFLAGADRGQYFAAPPLIGKEDKPIIGVDDDDYDEGGGGGGDEKERA